jgi:hypothetical protein
VGVRTTEVPGVRTSPKALPDMGDMADMAEGVPFGESLSYALGCLMPVLPAARASKPPAVARCLLVETRTLRCLNASLHTQMQLQFLKISVHTQR